MKFKISCLLFMKDESDRLLMIRRKKMPNHGLWSPPGGKLEMNTGESPVECAQREAFEETRIELKDNDLKLFGYVSEKNYQGNNHWLMFMFEVTPVLKYTPKPIDEGEFKFFYRSEINGLPIPPSDHQLVWPVYDKKNRGFWGLRADCASFPPDLKIEVSP